MTVVARRPMGEEPRATITLTGTQILGVIRQATVRAELSRVMAELESPHSLHDVVAPLIEDDSYSRSTLRALQVLGAFDLQGDSREVTDVARALALSASTAHRYVRTWMALGLLDQDPDSRRYRRAERPSAA